MESVQPSSDSREIHRNALAIGTCLKGIRVVRILGQGSFGLTYLGQDTSTGESVAIKEYLPIEIAVREAGLRVRPVSTGHEEAYARGLRRFLNEVSTLSLLDHPNVVKVRQAFELNETAYMVMSYEEGDSLQSLLAKGRGFTEADITDITLPLLDALEYLHERGLLHRDIKPGNIFIRSSGVPVLIDFGAVCQVVDEDARTVTSLFTLGYAPFEQYSGQISGLGPWTDLYSLGATLYRMVTGTVPVDAAKRGHAFIEQGADPLPLAVVAASNRYSDHLLSAVDHALAFRPSMRPQSVTVWRDELVGMQRVPIIEERQRWRTAMSASASQSLAALPAPGAAAPVADVHRPRWIGLSAFTLLACCVIAASMYFRSAPPREPAAVTGPVVEMTKSEVVATPTVPQAAPVVPAPVVRKSAPQLAVQTAAPSRHRPPAEIPPGKAQDNSSPTSQVCKDLLIRFGLGENLSPAEKVYFKEHC